MSTYANPSNQVAALKELYDNPTDYLQNLVYKQNPFLALVPKDESPSGFAGKYIPVPIIYATNQGRSHNFLDAQDNQTPTQDSSFFVYRISDYSIATITNELMEATKNDAGAFVDQAKLQVDGAIRSLTNNVALELFGSGTASRGRIGAYSFSNPTATITLSNIQQIVNFEVGMTLRASATDGGAQSDDVGVVASVNRSTGVITLTMEDAVPDSEWAIGGYMAVDGDVPLAGASSTASFRALSGLAAWLPAAGPGPSDNFWGVNRSTDSTRLGGCRYDGSSLTIEEALTNALAFVAREGGSPDICIIDFASYAALVNSLGAKVQYVQAKHDEVEVAFDGIKFQSAYGVVTVLADRSCPPQTAYLLTMSSWKLRSLGKVPHILTYGMEGLEGLRVGNADAMEVRIGYYGNLICNAPGWNCVVQLSA